MMLGYIIELAWNNFLTCRSYLNPLLNMVIMVRTWFRKNYYRWTVPKSISLSDLKNDPNIRKTVKLS